jgi:hypothetical protein
LAAARGLVVAATAGLLLGVASSARADPSPPPERHSAYALVSDGAVVATSLVALALPRLVFGDGQRTVSGWSTRWHVAAIAPLLVVGGAAALNELWFKDQIGSARPGCDDSNVGVAGCTSNGGPSTHGLVLGAGVGVGIGLLAVDSYRAGTSPPTGAWFAYLALPMTIATIGDAARIASKEESAGQVLAGTALGVVIGAASSAALAYFSPANCGYEAGLFCW